ncbi:conserved Plasmodium protein, unknown function [Plasmodium gaboni]|uniref:Symplekin C-terminal domain-containing protein n=1 Tax=Plasmodium gaboni TaxID=647221 RepID=A0ABY1UQB1_9APIC|nr:conserved Plasmodium protein, unknown function [Plasmodium gaboni]
MCKDKKKKILKAIKVLEKKDEKEEEKLIELINEVDQIFLHCLKNDEDIYNKKIINTYIIPYMNLLLERLLFYYKDDGMNNNMEDISNKVNILSHVLIFLSSIIKINKKYSYIIICYYVNLLESKYHLIKIVENIKNIILHLLRGLLFSFDIIYNELENIKRGIQNYVLLKCKLFNMIINFHFNPFLYNHPYKYILIKNLFLIITKEIIFYFHILKNKKNIFKQILIQAKPTHHLINNILNIKYLDYLIQKDNIKNNYDHFILIWLEQNIRLFNDLILFYIRNDNTSDSSICQSKDKNNDNINKSNTNNNFEYQSELDEEEKMTKENVEDTYKIDIYNKLIYYINDNNYQYNIMYDNINNNNKRDTINYTFDYNNNNTYLENETNYIYDKYMDYEDNFYSSKYLLNDNKSYNNKNIYSIHMYHLISNIDHIKIDSLIFLTHLIKNIFSLIRQEPFILNFFVENIFIMIKKLLNLFDVYKKSDDILIKEEENQNAPIKNVGDNTINNNNNNNKNNNNMYKNKRKYKIKVVECLLEYIKNELYILICKKNVNAPFYYSYINKLLNIIGEKGTTEELIKKKFNTINNIYNTDIMKEDKKIHIVDNNYQKFKRNILRKDNYGYKKITKEHIDIMCYLKVKINETDSNMKHKKEEKENMFINQIIKKLYLTNFKLDKKYYQRFNCSKDVNIEDLIENEKKNNKIGKEKYYYDKNVLCDDKNVLCDDKNISCDDKNISCDDINISCDDKNISCDDKITRVSQSTNNNINNKDDDDNDDDAGNNLIQKFMSKFITSNKCQKDEEKDKEKEKKKNTDQDNNKIDIIDDCIYNYQYNHDNIIIAKNYDSQNEELLNVKDIKYTDLYRKFFFSDIKYYENIKDKEDILTNIDLYYFIIFSQIINNNLENQVKVLGENIFLNKINNIKIINNIVKRIIFNHMLKEQLKFFFLCLYIIKINSFNIYQENIPSDIFMNYSTLFKLYNNLLFYLYIQEEKKKKKKYIYILKLNHEEDVNVKVNQNIDVYQNNSCVYNFTLDDTYHIMENENIIDNSNILGYTKVCYNYFFKLKKKLDNSNTSCIYRSELQNKSFKIKCTYDETLNLILYILHNENLLLKHRDQYIKTFIEQILETPKLSFSFFIYLIIWLHNIEVHVDFKGYINNTNSDKQINIKIKDTIIQSDTNLDINKEDQEDVYANLKMNHNKNKENININISDDHMIQNINDYTNNYETDSYFNVDFSDHAYSESEHSNDTSTSNNINNDELKNEACNYYDNNNSKNNDLKQPISMNNNNSNQSISMNNNISFNNYYNEEKKNYKDELFNINYYIKYNISKSTNMSNNILCFSLISNLLKKNQNIKCKKTILCIYMNTLFNCRNDIRTLLKKLITATKGIYNNSLNYFVYTKKIFRYYHKIFILFLLYICNMYFQNLKDDILFFSYYPFYLWPVELINFIHNFLLSNFSFFYNDIISLFRNNKQLGSYEKKIFSSKDYNNINKQVDLFLNNFYSSTVEDGSLESFMKDTDFFNNKNEVGEHENCSSNINNHNNIKNISLNIYGQNFIEQEEKECLHKNEISQRILLEEIFIFLFIKTIDLLEDNNLWLKLKETNIFLNFLTINYVKELIKFIFSNIQNTYEKNKENFWLQFNILINEQIEDDKTKNNENKIYLKLKEISNFVLNSIDNYLSICVRSTIFFHLYIFIFNNCKKKEIKKLLLNKFIITLPLLKSLFHEEFFRILKYNNKILSQGKEQDDNIMEKSHTQNHNEEHNNDHNNDHKDDHNDDNNDDHNNNNIDNEQNKNLINKNEDKNNNNIVLEESNDINNNDIKNTEENNPFQINIEIIKYISTNLYKSLPSSDENYMNFLNFCFNLYLENNNFEFIIEMIAFLKKEQTLQIFNDIIKNENIDENKKIEFMKCCINNIVKLPYAYILEKKKYNDNDNETYYVTNADIFYLYYNLNKYKNIQRVMLDYFVTKVNLNTIDNDDNTKMFNDITIKDLASIIQQIAENSNTIFPIYGRFLCQITKNINILREFVSSIIIPLLIQKKIWTNKFIWKGCLMCISMLWPDFKHSLFYIFFMLPSDECSTLFHALEQKHSISSDLIELISTNEQAKRMCPDYLKNLLNT